MSDASPATIRTTGPLRVTPFSYSALYSDPSSFLLGIVVTLGGVVLYSALFPHFLIELLVADVDFRYLANNLYSQLKTRPTERIIKKYQEQAKVRKEGMNKVDNSNQYARIYNNLAPEVFCAEQVKVGKTDDGGKWMCAPWNLPKDCIIFSIGLNDEVSFEEDIQTMTNQRCRLLAFDQGEQSAQTRKRLANVGTNSSRARISTLSKPKQFEYTLPFLMTINNVDKIEILKIDIEASEFSVLPLFLEKHQVSQILIELHGSPKQTLEFLRYLSSLGYLHFHYEINGKHHNLAEYSFIHKNVLDRYDATLLSRFLT